MIGWNISREKENSPIWSFLDMSPKEYLIFSSDPEAWADNYFERFSDT